MYSPSVSLLQQQRTGVAHLGHIRTDFLQPAPLRRVSNPGLWLLAGDDRVNENPVLHALFYVFGSYHNLVADKYAADHPAWDDETVFQEARAWTIAVYQKIVTREFYAAMVGRALPTYTSAAGQVAFNGTTNPSVDNFFGSTSFRFLDVTKLSSIPRLDDQLNPISQGPLLLRDSLDAPTSYYLEDAEHGIWSDNGTMKASAHAAILRGVADTLAGRVEPAMVDDLRNFMFAPTNPRVAVDLASNNIQRGRDHGIRTRLCS